MNIMNLKHMLFYVMLTTVWAGRTVQGQVSQVPELTMLVHIVFEAGRDPELCRGVGDCVHRAIDAALGSSCGNTVRIVTERVLDSQMPSRQFAERGAAKSVAIAVLMYPRSRLSGRTKRVLFGRIGEAVEGEFQISRGDLVIGIIETPARNWTFGYDRTELALVMEGGLP